MSKQWPYPFLIPALLGLVLVVAISALGACIPPPADGVRGIEPYLEGPADYEAAWRGQPIEQSLERRNAELMAQPLDKDAAVELALLNHPGLRADIQEIDVLGPLLRQQTALRNPEFETDIFFSIDRRRAERVESGLRLDVTSLIDRGARVRAVSAELEQIRAQAATQIVALITAVRLAWIDAVAARETLALERQFVEEHQAIAEDIEAGELSESQLLRLRADIQEQHLALSQTEQRALDARRRLHQWLGVDHRQWSLPVGLDAPPDEIEEPVGLATIATERSTDLARLRQVDEKLHHRIGVSHWRGWVPRLELGAAGEWEPEPRPFIEWDPDEWDIGPSIRLSLPLFDRQQALRDSLQSQRIQVDFDAQQTRHSIALSARQTTRDLYSAYDRARHYELELLPLRHQIADDARDRYKAGDTGVIDVFEARQRLLQTRRSLVEARRNFWRAQAHIDHLRSGGPPLSEDRPTPVRR